MARKTDRSEFVAIMVGELAPAAMTTTQLAEWAEHMMSSSRTLQYLAVQDCNHGLTTAELARDEAVMKRVVELCKPYGIVPVFSGDPRGCVLKIKVPSGRTNDFAGEGICVPS